MWHPPSSDEDHQTGVLRPDTKARVDDGVLRESLVSYDIELSFLPISLARPAPSATQLSSARSRQPARRHVHAAWEPAEAVAQAPNWQTSMSRVAALQSAKRAKRTLYRPRIDNIDSS